MIEDETFNEIDDTLDIDRGAEIMKAPANKPTRTSPVSYTHLTLPTTSMV